MALKIPPINFLEALIRKARNGSCSINITATGEGLTVMVSAYRGAPSVTRTVSFWIDKNEPNMVALLEEHIRAVQ